MATSIAVAGSGRRCCTGPTIRERSDKEISQHCDGWEATARLQAGTRKTNNLLSGFLSPDSRSLNASLDAGALLHNVRVCIQALTKRKLILLPVKQRHWLRQQFRDAIQRTGTCRSKFFSVASATPTSILSATNGANSWRRTIQ